MWVAEHFYEILGTRFAVRSDDAVVADSLADLLAPFQSADARPVRARDRFVLAASRPGDDQHHAFRDCRRFVRSESWNRIFDSLIGELNRRAVEEMGYFGVHAGVIATAERTIALPGPSAAGKSTLVGACVQAGFSYVSDEALCVDYSTGAVVPYPKPLSLSAWSLETLNLSVPDGLNRTKAPVSAAALGEIAKSPLRLTDLVLFDRQPGQASLRPLPSSEVVASLIRFSFNHFRRPADAFRLVTDLARDSAGWSLSYEDPRAAADLMRQVLRHA